MNPAASSGAGVSFFGRRGIGRQDGAAGRSAELCSGLPTGLLEQVGLDLGPQVWGVGQRTGLFDEHPGAVAVDVSGCERGERVRQTLGELARQLDPVARMARRDPQLCGDH